MFVIKIFITLTSAVLVYANNKCPEAKPMDNFDLDLYAQGIWYELARYANHVEEAGNCVVLNYTKRGDDFLVEVTEVEDNTLIVYDGHVNIRPSDEHKGLVHYEFMEGDDKFEMNVTFLDTDYNNYIIKYICVYDEAIDDQFEFAWIVSKYKELTPEAKATVSEFIASSPVLDESKFVWNTFSKDGCKHEKTKIEQHLREIFN